MFGAHAVLFECFHNPPNSGMNYRIFNVCNYVTFLHAYIDGDLGLCYLKYCSRVRTEFDSENLWVGTKLKA